MTELLKVYKDEDPQLRVVCKDVTEFDDELATIADNMWATMMVNRGCGLAANQVGLDINLICVKGSRFSGFMVNPRWLGPKYDDSSIMKEGCLSIPGKSINKSRFNTINVKYLDLNGKECNIKLSGWDARIVQHECDHLAGVLMTDPGRSMYG